MTDLNTFFLGICLGCFSMPFSLAYFHRTLSWSFSSHHQVTIWVHSSVGKGHFGAVWNDNYTWPILISILRLICTSRQDAWSAENKFIFKIIDVVFNPNQIDHPVYSILKNMTNKSIKTIINCSAAWLNYIFLAWMATCLILAWKGSWTRLYQKLFSFQNLFSMHSLKFAVFVVNERSAKAVELEQSKIDIINIVRV